MRIGRGGADASDAVVLAVPGEAIVEQLNRDAGFEPVYAGRSRTRRRRRPSPTGPSSMGSFRGWAKEGMMPDQPDYMRVSRRDKIPEQSEGGATPWTNQPQGRR
jgi:hypothetical protein